MAYATVADLRARINANFSDDDTVLTALIAAAEATVDEYCNRPDGFEADTVASAREFVTRSRGYCLIDECVEVTQVESRPASELSLGYTVLAATAWTPFAGDPAYPSFQAPYNGIVVSPGYSLFDGRVTGWDFPIHPDDRADHHRMVPTVRVTAKWGRSVSVPTPVREATIIIATQMYKRGQGAYATSTASDDLGAPQFAGGMDKDVKLLLNRYVRPSV